MMMKRAGVQRRIIRSRVGADNRGSASFARDAQPRRMQCTGGSVQSE